MKNAYHIRFWVGQGYKKSWIIVASDAYEALNQAQKQFIQPRQGSWLCTPLQENVLYDLTHKHFSI